MTTLVREFASIEAALAVAREEPGFSGSARAERDSGWSGASFDEAMDMAERGYPAGAAKLKLRAGLMAKVREAKRPVPVWGPSGSSVDIGRYLSGEADCMVEVVRGRRPSPVVRIAIERCVNSGIPTSDIEATGASVLAAVEALRTAGIPSEIWVHFSIMPMSYARDGGYSLQVLIQETGRPIDLDVLAFWTVHPAALRRIAFAIEEHEDSTMRRAFGVPGGYGMPTTPEALGTAADFDEVVPAYARQAEEWLLDVLERRIGVTLDGGA